jgi:hypothetical protein
MGGHYDGGGFPIELAGSAHELDPIHTRHPQIGEKQIGRKLLELREGLETISGSLYLISLVAKELRQRGAGIGLVIYDQNPPPRAGEPNYLPVSGIGGVSRNTCALGGRSAEIAGFLGKRLHLPWIEQKSCHLDVDAKRLRC